MAAGPIGQHDAQRRDREVSTRHAAPVLVEGGNWGPGHFGPAPPSGWPAPGVVVIAPNVVLGWGGRPPFDPARAVAGMPGFAPAPPTLHAPHVPPAYPMGPGAAGQPPPYGSYGSPAFQRPQGPPAGGLHPWSTSPAWR